MRLETPELPKSDEFDPACHLGDGPHCHRVHLRTGGEVNAGFEAELFVEGGSNSANPLPSSKVSDRNKSKLPLFLAPAMN